MAKKASIRKKYLLKRKKRYFEINKNFLDPFSKMIRGIYKDKKINISIYFPCQFEVNILKIFDNKYFQKFNFLLPVIEKNKSMNFYKWKINEILKLNEYGIPEPIKSSKIVPNIALVPLIAFDKKKNRLGYGKGFYDKYFEKHDKNNKKILTVGVAFSFQKYDNLPISKKDVRLNYVLTEKGII